MRVLVVDHQALEQLKELLTLLKSAGFEVTAVSSLETIDYKLSSFDVILAHPSHADLFVIAQEAKERKELRVILYTDGLLGKHDDKYFIVPETGNIIYAEGCPSQELLRLIRG